MVLCSNRKVGHMKPVVFRKSGPSAKSATKLTNAVRTCMEQLELRRMLSVSADAGGPYVVDSANTVSIHGNAIGAENVAYKWDLNYDGSHFHTQHTGQAFSYTAPDDGVPVRKIALKVINTDNTADFSVATTTLVSGISTEPGGDVVLTASIAGLPDGNESDEGTTLHFTSNVTDPGTADPLTYDWVVTQNDSEIATGHEANFDFTPTDDGSYVVGLVVTDNDDVSVQADPQTITVDNVAPTAEIIGPEETVDEGGSVNVIASISDPSSVDTEAGFTIHWVIQRDGQDYDSGSGPEFSFDTDDSGDYTVNVAVTDKDDFQSTTGQVITVHNVAPEGSITGAPDGSVAEGTLITFGS